MNEKRNDRQQGGTGRDGGMKEDQGGQDRQDQQQDRTKTGQGGGGQQQDRTKTGQVGGGQQQRQDEDRSRQGQNKDPNQPKPGRDIEEDIE